MLEWTEPVKATAWATGGLAYPFTRTLRLFGHAAPATFMEPSELSPGGAGFGLSTKTNVALEAKQGGDGGMTIADPSAQSSRSGATRPRRCRASCGTSARSRRVSPLGERRGGGRRDRDEPALPGRALRRPRGGREAPRRGHQAGRHEAPGHDPEGRPGARRARAARRHGHPRHGVAVGRNPRRPRDRRRLRARPGARALGRALPGPGHRRHRLPAGPPRRGRRRGGGRAADRRGRARERGRAAPEGARGRPRVRALGRGLPRRRAPQGAADDPRRRRRGLLPSRAQARRGRDARPRRGHGRPHGNVARASHGETVRDEVLGSGDASARFQRFRLARSPLTLVPGGGEGGVASTLELLVDGVRWTEVPTLYGQAPDARVYTARLADDGTTELQFGDGVQGARLPTGRGNVRATYRVGSASRPALGADRLTTALDRPPGLLGVTNPLAATGGADPETRDAARRSAPTTVRTFGRAVSLRDFEDLVTVSGEVAKAQAIWMWDGLDRAIHLTVAAQEGGLFTEDDLRRLTRALTAARDPNHRLRLANHVPVDVVVRASLRRGGPAPRRGRGGRARRAPRRARLRRAGARPPARHLRRVPHPPGRPRRRLRRRGRARVRRSGPRPRRAGSSPGPCSRTSSSSRRARTTPSRAACARPSSRGSLADAGRNRHRLRRAGVVTSESAVLYELLPAVYREHDADKGFPLRALLAIIAEQADVLETDVAQLWDDLFIETAQPWVIPYIGDLVGNDLLFDASRVRGPRRPRRSSTTSPAPTCGRPSPCRRAPTSRRRSTTAAARARCRCSRSSPATSPAGRRTPSSSSSCSAGRSTSNHSAPQAAGPTSARPSATGRIDGAVRRDGHTVDVRPISTLDGWHRLNNVGFFLWRLRAYPLERVPAREDDRSWRFHSSPLGNPAPLFTRWRREGDEAGLATELHVPGPIRHATFHAGSSRATGSCTAPWTTRRRACHLVHNGTPVPPAEIACRRLDPWPAARPPGKVIGVDVATGRLAVGDGFDDRHARRLVPLRLPGRPRRRPVRPAPLAGHCRPTRRFASRSPKGRRTTRRGIFGSVRPRSPTGPRRPTAARTRS